MQHGATWCNLVQDGARWCKMVQNGARWRKMAQDGARWRKMAQDGARWRKMAQHGATWCNMKIVAGREKSKALLQEVPADLCKKVKYRFADCFREGVWGTAQIRQKYFLKVGRGESPILLINIFIPSPFPPIPVSVEGKNAGYAWPCCVPRGKSCASSPRGSLYIAKSHPT